MKKSIISILAFCAVIIPASGQTMYDALNFSQNNYYGTAKTQAMGNAVTALGGDLGTVGINPAGSAVAGYSQFTITPGLTVSSVNSSYAPVYGEGGESAFHNNKTRFTMPNLGVSFRLETGRRLGLKSMTMSFVSNGTAQHLFESVSGGNNNMSTLSGSFAATANMNADGSGNMMDPNVFKNYADPYRDSYYGWNQLSAYQSNMISYTSADNCYVGVAENIDGKIPGTLHQMSSRLTTGVKNDMVANLGFNISDKFYFGFNLGIPVQRYNYEESFRETPQDPEQFPVSFTTSDGQTVVTNFKELQYKYAYSANIDGVYGKFGFIYLPVEGLRVGAAIQTPTLLTITESWRNNSYTEFADSRFSAEGLTPQGQYRYTLRTPYSANFGLAYVFGTRGLVSVDYEIADFSVMKFNEINYDNVQFANPFEVQNTIMKLFNGVQHQLRIGAEYRLNPQFTLRAGYVVTTSPELHYTTYVDGQAVTVYATDYEANWEDFRSYKLLLSDKSYDYARNVRTVSAGLGYDSGKSFFADASFRCSMYPVDNFATYAQYYDNIPSPNVATVRRLMDAALTLGWRF